MNRTIVHRLLRVLFMLLCTLFLLSACSDSDKAEGGTPIGGNESTADASSAQHACWQGSLLEEFYKTIGSQTDKVYQAMTKEKLLNVVMLAFAIWMAYQILRHVSSPTPESIGEFWTKVMRKGFLCMLCGTLASSSDQLYYVLNNFIFPIYITILEFASEVLKIMGESSDASAKGIKIMGDIGLEDGNDYICEQYSHSITDSSCSINSANMKMNAGKFPDEPKNMMSCMACAVSDRLGVGYTIAIHLMKKASLSAFIAGGFLIVCFTIVKIGFAFYLVDSIFRLNMMVVILPFLVIFYPFEQTRKWSVTGVKIILNSSAIMMCLAVIVSMTILAMQNMLINPNMGMNFANKEEYEYFGTTSLSLIFMGFLIIKATGMSVELSGVVTGGAGEARFQKKVQALAATVLKTVFAIVTAGSGKVATTAIEHVERIRAIAEKAQKMQAKAKRVANKINNMAGRE